MLRSNLIVIFSMWALHLFTPLRGDRQRYWLGGSRAPVLTVGRSRCIVKLRNPQSSRVHAYFKSLPLCKGTGEHRSSTAGIEEDAIHSQVTIEDVSVNGTFVQHYRQSDGHISLRPGKPHKAPEKCSGEYKKWSVVAIRFGQ